MEVLDCGLGLVGALAAFSSVSPFFLKKLTLKTLRRDQRKAAPLPGRAKQFNLLLSFTPSSFLLFSLSLTSNGHSLSSSPAASPLTCSLTLLLSTLECALANSFLQSPPRLKVNLMTALVPFRFLLRAVMISSGSLLPIYNECNNPHVQTTVRQYHPHTHHFFARLQQYFFNLGMQSSGSCRGMPNWARQLFFRSIQICRICMSLRVSLVKVRQNLFISGDMDPGYVPYAYPEIPIMRQYNTTQKYLNSGRQPFFTRLWQVISIALAIRNSPKLCRVFFSRKITDRKPPTNPARMGMYFCRSSATHLLSAQRMVLKMSTKLPTKSPKFLESLLVRILMRLLGDLKMRLIPKTVDSPALIRQLKKVILALSLRMASIHPRLCLQLSVLEQGIRSARSTSSKGEGTSSSRGWAGRGWLLINYCCYMGIINYGVRMSNFPLMMDY